MADEQLTWVARQQVDVPTTVGGGCFLGVSVVTAATTAALETGYGACARAAQAVVHRSGAVAVMGLKRCRRRADFIPASDGPQAHCTSQAVDRLLNSQDRLLDAMRSGHATTALAAGGTRDGATRELSPVWRAAAS